MELLKFRGLRFNLSEQQRYIEESAALDSGGILLVQGPSGSGKSTLLKMLARLLPCHCGQVSFQGRDWKTISPLEWRTRVHYVPQKPVLFDGSLEDNLRRPFSLRIIQRSLSYPSEQIAAYMKLLGLPQELLQQDARLLSGGEAARVCLLRSILINPEVLLLDEPTAALDDANRILVNQFISSWVGEQANRGVVLVSHHQEDRKYLRSISVLNMTAGN